jgi:alkylation response protein AidB-like acyl-CoA dehydrogenase
MITRTMYREDHEMFRATVRRFVDARVSRIYGGTSEVMKELISRGL